MSALGQRAAEVAARREADARSAHFARRFGDTLRAADASGAESVVQEALTAGLPPATIHSRVITPAMYRIGDLWAASAITVADEHLATAICQRTLAALYPAFRAEPAHSRARILLAAVQGQHHVLGLRMAADVLEGAGHEVLHLGADVPTDALCAAVERHEPDLIGLSLTLSIGLAHLEDALHRIQQVRPDTTVLLGGQGISRRLKDAGWPYVDHADELLPAIERLLAAPPRMPVAATPLAPGLVDLVAPAEERGIGTAEDRLSQLVSDAADMARQESRRARDLYDAAFRDPLTDLYNRRALDEKLAAGVPEDAILLMIDLDGFKAVNDTHGHAEGDVLLQRVGDLMRAGLRLGDFAARYGGDEFAVVLHGCDPERAAEIAERLRSTAEVALADHGVTFSIGGARGEHAVARADDALYRAKRSGRNRVDIDA